MKKFKNRFFPWATLPRFSGGHTYIGSPRGAEIFQVFPGFFGAARSKNKGIWLPGRHQLLRHVFLRPHARGEPRRRFLSRFPGRFRNQEIFHIFPKFLDGFLELLPPKTAESGPGTVTSFFPMLFSCPGSCGEPGRPLSGQETPIWAPETFCALLTS